VANLPYRERSNYRLPKPIGISLHSSARSPTTRLRTCDLEDGEVGATKGFARGVVFIVDPHKTDLSWQGDEYATYK
jgi:hypothetical protein